MPEDLSQDAQRLLRHRKSGALATHCVVNPGFPFVSAAPYAIIDNGNCVFLFSALSSHSKNLRANDQASLLVTGSDGDLSEARLTLQGHVRPVEDGQSSEAKKKYIEAHPAAAQWASFGDFSMMELSPVACYFVGGFGKMGWIKPEQWKA